MVTVEIRHIIHKFPSCIARASCDGFADIHTLQETYIPTGINDLNWITESTIFVTIMA